MLILFVLSLQVVLPLHCFISEIDLKTLSIKTNSNSCTCPAWRNLRYELTPAQVLLCYSPTLLKWPPTYHQVLQQHTHVINVFMDNWLSRLKYQKLLSGFHFMVYFLTNTARTPCHTTLYLQMGHFHENGKIDNGNDTSAILILPSSKIPDT